MRIVGIDCGAEKTGFGVIESDGRSHRFLNAGIVRTRPAEPFERRLHVIAARLREIVSSAAPDCVAIEEVFHAVNTRSALKLAHVRGVALLVAAETGVPVAEYSALEVKTSVVGYGRAEKSQVELMVRSLLRVTHEFESYDATDALAIALCHATRAPFEALTQARS